MNLKPFVEIIRPANCLMAAIAVFIGFAVSAKTYSVTLPVVFAMAAAFLICGAGQAINDYFDFEVDKKIRREKPLPSGKIERNTALAYSMILFLAGILISWLVNFEAFGIALAFSLLLISYSALMQKQKFIGNIVVALGTAFTRMFGASIVQKYGTIIFFAASAFFANMAREIIKDSQDMEADKGRKTTFPMILSAWQVQAAVYLMYALAVIIAFFAWGQKIVTNGYYILFLPAATLVFLHSFNLFAENKEKEAQQFSKIGMAISLLAFLMGAF